MSRKNLSRTVIEGGRYHRNQFARNASHGIERASTRAWLDRAFADLDEADYTAPAPRPSVDKVFYDKLAPAIRWLDRHVGRRWDTVYSELCATFDRRTVAGKHVVDAHMLQAVWRGDVSMRSFQRERYFVVDARGILRRGRFFGRSFGRLRKDMLAWSQQRRAALTRLGWWWFRVVPIGAACRDHRCRRAHALHAYESYHRIHYVPERALGRGELRRFQALPDELRRELVIALVTATDA